MPATKFEHPDYPDAPIYCIGEYVPWGWHKSRGGDSSNYPGFSSSILDLKNSRGRSIENFAALVSKGASKRYYAVTAVPGHAHDTTKINPVASVARRVASALEVVDGRQFLRRAKPIQKLASGGDRSIDVHLSSIVTEHERMFVGKRLLLLDDVLTSGNSMAACWKLLMDAGASEVICVAFAKTTH